MCAWTLSPQQTPKRQRGGSQQWASILAAATVIRVARRMDSTLCVPRARLRPRSLTRVRAARAAAARAAAARRATRRAARSESVFKGSPAHRRGFFFALLTQRLTYSDIGI